MTATTVMATTTLSAEAQGAKRFVLAERSSPLEEALPKYEKRSAG